MYSFGFDTETFNGYAKLLCCSNKKFIESNNTYDYIDFLYKNGSFSSQNFFYNLGYDFVSIMKEFFIHNKELTYIYNKQKNIDLKIKRLEALDKDITEDELILLNKLRLSFNIQKAQFHIKEYTISVIGNKSFSIKKNNSKLRISFYDIAGFYIAKSGFITLEKAVSLYLNLHKNADELKISPERIGTEENYYENNRDNIIKYCKKDADLTNKLFINLFNVLLLLNLPIPKKWYSKGSLTKVLLNSKPSINKELKAYKELAREIKKYAKNAFHGGLFKINYVGNFKDVYNLDINSAYPTMIKKLHTLRKCKIIDLNNKYFSSCFYKFYLIKCKANPLFITKINNNVKYVYSKRNLDYYITEYDKEILDLYKIKYKIISGLGIITKENKVFDKIVLNLYESKKQAKEKFGKNSYQYILIKTIANSLYGITAEQHPLQSKFTNFIFASYITAYCRNYINKLAFKIQSVGGKILTFETDGLVYQLQDPKMKQYLTSISGPELGQINIQSLKEITIFENGIQQLIDNNNNITNKTRGFQDLNLELLRKYDHITYLTKHKHIKKLNSSIIQKKLEYLNIITEEEKEFTPINVLLVKYKNDEVIQKLLYSSLKDYFIHNYKLTYDTI